MGLIASSLEVKDLPWPMRLMDDIRRFAGDDFDDLYNLFFGSGSALFLDDLSRSQLGLLHKTLVAYIEWNDRAWTGENWDHTLRNAINAIDEMLRLKCPH